MLRWTARVLECAARVLIVIMRLSKKLKKRSLVLGGFGTNEDYGQNAYLKILHATIHLSPIDLELSGFEPEPFFVQKKIIKYKRSIKQTLLIGTTSSTN